MAHAQPTETKQYPSRTHHPRFARFYELLSRTKASHTLEDPLREETAGRAHGVVLEVGAGNGLNFAFYKPGQVERVEAIEPDSAMQEYARKRVEESAVPITLIQAPAEALPFADNTFDSAVTTLVFCSVADPLQGFREIKRVLKPGGDLYLFEHIRADNKLAANIQGLLVPLTTRMAGNCHWNRPTLDTLSAAGLLIAEKRLIPGTLQPIVVVHATRP